MKRPIQFIFSYVLLLALLTLGAGILLLGPREERLSESENRMLSAPPVLSGETVLSGDYMEGFENYLADAFPARDRVIGLTRSIRGLLGERDEDTAIQEAIAREERAAEEARNEPIPETTPEPETDSGPETEQAPAEDTRPEARDASFWLVRADGSRDVQETYTAAHLDHLARVLDEYRDCLPADGHVMLVNVPVSSYYHILRADGGYTDWDSDLPEALSPLVGEGVEILDAADILRPYLFTEDLYPTGDHHWHAVSAWHVARAMTEILGLPPADFLDSPYHLEYTFHGDAYTPEQLQSMSVDPQNRWIPVPLTPVESYIVTYMDQLEPSAYLESDRQPGYGIYLGGRRRPWRLFVTGYHTGRTALIIGDSFYHAFLPYMTPCYDRILSTDLRSDMYVPELTGGSIRQYMEAYGVDDVYLVSCTYTSLNDYVYQDRLETFLNTDYGAIYGRGNG